MAIVKDDNINHAALMSNLKTVSFFCNIETGFHCFQQWMVKNAQNLSSHEFGSSPHAN